jgi:glycosyltransferase involved in cell wall biosynthesis
VPVERQTVVYVQPNSEVGGSDLALLRTVEALDHDRLRPVVVLPRDGPLVPLLHAAGAKIRFVPMVQLRTLPSASYQARYLTRFWPTVAQLNRVIREEDARLVHSNSLYSLYGAFAAVTTRRRHLWHIREIPPAIPIAKPALAQTVLALSHMVIAMTRACAEGLFGRNTGHPKIHFLSEGLDLSAWCRARIDRSIRTELGVLPEVPVIGFVGRLDPWKGLNVFLEAAALVAVSFPNAVFVVAGDAPAGFEAYRDRMITRAAELGLGKRVHFLGWRYRLNDIPAVMASLDVFSHTSIQPEPFGLVLIEAMAMGCPVVAARAGGPLEIIEEGVSGCLTPPGDAHAHAEAICALLADPVYRNRVREGARARVVERYSLGAFRAQLVRLYDAALDGVQS